MLVNIVRVKYLDGYKLELEFENGVVKVVNFEEDLKKYSGPVVTPLKDIEYFKRVRLNKRDWNNRGGILVLTVVQAIYTKQELKLKENK